MTEEWKDIEGFEGKYQVSNFGRVKSLNYNRCGYSRLLVPKINNYGYEWVELFANGKGVCRQVHRLVAMAFIPNPNEYPVINHRDENIRNNRADNLEWCDQRYNTRYSLNLHQKERSTRKHKRPIAQIDKDGNIVKIWDYSRQVEKEGNMSQWSILQCCNGKRKTAYGYTWHYADAI